MKIIIIDDDPTGSQTVHSCPLILSWDKETIAKGINDKSPLLFILANTRSLSKELAAQRTKEICIAIIDACSILDLSPNEILIISRGDSTLRGHALLEPEIISEVIGPFDAIFHVPAFLEGGRTTLNGIHFLDKIPVHKSNYAKDLIFGYSTSYLPDWLEEKSNRTILSENVACLNVEFLNEAIQSKIGLDKLINWLLSLKDQTFVVVDAELYCHIEVFCFAIKHLLDKKRFLFRSAASLINGFANLPMNQYSQKDLVGLRLKNELGSFKPGLIMIGSHVDLADRQLSVLLSDENCLGLELPVKKLAEFFEFPSDDNFLYNLESILIENIYQILAAKKTPVLYTSRKEFHLSSELVRINFGNFLANFMANLVSSLSIDLGYIISKGGITTNTLLTNGLNYKFLRLKGQILPGLSVVCSLDQTYKNSIPIITFPGNLGDDYTLLEAWQLMEEGADKK